MGAERQVERNAGGGAGWAERLGVDRRDGDGGGCKQGDNGGAKRTAGGVGARVGAGYGKGREEGAQSWDQDNRVQAGLCLRRGGWPALGRCRRPGVGPDGDLSEGGPTKDGNRGKASDKQGGGLEMNVQSGGSNEKARAN